MQGVKKKLCPSIGIAYITDVRRRRTLRMSVMQNGNSLIWEGRITKENGGPSVSYQVKVYNIRKRTPQI